MARVGRAGALLALLGISLASCGGDEVMNPTAPGCPSAAERARAFAFCPDGADLAARVDPLIGTGASGNTTPAVRVPHGMVKVGPTTQHATASVVAYEYESPRIEGFTHDNLTGPGGSFNGYDQILLLPVVGALDGTDPGSAFSHSSESAEVDRYAVTLDDYGVKVELMNLGTPPDYVTLGYVPQECDADQSASMTLEYAYDDWCTAKIAGALGKTDAESAFMKRSQSFMNQWDASAGFMRPKRADGTWVSPFDPTTDSLTNGFTEASAWIYTWFVPHDVPALVQLVGGPDAFVQKLDAFFAQYFDPGNEPSFHTPYLYNFAGRPDKTEERVHEVLTTRYAAAPDGLPGNDDSGATSAWYVLSAIGIYPVAPGDGVYQLTTPLFDRVTLAFDGAWFVIETKRSSPDDLYIESASLNGEPLDMPELRHADIVRGGTLELTAGPAPSGWGQ
jgi:putative alpha-1,2-mannosidase